MTRTFTDAQLAAKWDEEPWHHPDSVTSRSPFNVHDRWVFAPRLSEVPTVDPSPFLFPNKSRAYFSYVIPRPLAKRVEAKFLPRPWPELQAAGVSRVPGDDRVNPILNAFRDYSERFAGQRERVGLLREFIAAMDIGAAGVNDATPEQVVSARIILERLARVMEMSE